VVGVVVSRWAAWAPALEKRDDWERWRREPAPLGFLGTPDVGFLPPLLRRRCSRLSRLMLHVAYAACEPAELSALPTVFASRYGEMPLTVSLLEALARREPVTASAFTHSVHNTQVGLFSIAAKNRQMTSALAAGSNTFASAFIEALALMQRAGGGGVLLVVGGEPLPPVFEKFQDEPAAAYALALVLAPSGDGPGLRLAPGRAEAARAAPAWPQAIEFLRWLLSEEPSLTLGAGRHAWTWTRREP